MKKLIALVGFLSFFLIGTAAAEESELSYSYVAVSYIDGDIVDLDADGFGIRGSIGFASSWFASAEYNATEIDDADVDLDELTFDVGYHWGVGSKTDLFATVGYTFFEVDDGNNSENADGYDINFGVRGKPVDQFEYGVSVGYYDGGDAQYAGEARYQFSEPVSVGIRYRSNDLFDLWGVDLRYDF